MRIVFMGTPDFALVSLKALCDAGHEVAAVFTQTDKPKGRGNRLCASPVKEYALKEGITVYQPASLKRETAEYAGIISSLQPDVIVVVAYGKLLPPEILNIPRLGCVNVHGSLLPSYRGAAPIQWTVINGDEYGGITTMLMSEKMDAGDILLQQPVKLDFSETASEYYQRLSHVGAELLVKTLSGLEKNEIAPIKQDESGVSLAPVLTRSMSRISFDMPAERVFHMIMGLSDWPCAECVIDGKKLKIYRCELVDMDSCHAPGTVLDSQDFTVACGRGSVRLTEVQAEGGKRMPAKAYLLGHPIKKGTVLE